MEPVTIILLTIGGIGSLLAAGAGGVAVGVAGAKASMPEPEPVDSDPVGAIRLQEDLDYAQRRLADAHEDLARAGGDRDRYRTMAESHDIHMPEVAETQMVERSVWKDRRYRAHPRDILTNLATDLEEYAGSDLTLTISISGKGGWADHLKERWFKTESQRDRYGHYKEVKVPIKEIKGFTFEGPPDRVIDHLRTLLTDDDTGLVTVAAVDCMDTASGSDRFVGPTDKIALAGKPSARKATVVPQAKFWRDSDSPLLVKAKLTVREEVKSPPAPEVQIVEVLVVQERIVERIVEKPVIVAVPSGTEQDLCGHTREEISDLISVELELAQLEGGLKRVATASLARAEAEVEAARPADDVDERLRRARAASLARQPGS